MALRIYAGATKAEMAQLPSPTQLKPSHELIWSEDTGRAQEGANKAKMIGSVVAEKMSYQISWGVLPLSSTDHNNYERILAKLPKGFFFFGIGENLSDAKANAIKVYRSEIAGEIMPVKSAIYYKGVSVTVIEQ